MKKKENKVDTDVTEKNVADLNTENQESTINNNTTASDTDNQPAPNEEALIPDELILLKNRIEDLETANKELNDKYLRLSAEFDNYRKRTLRERMELTKTASESVMLSILPVIDDFERAIKAIEQGLDFEATKEGLSLIYNKFKEFNKQNGISEIKAEGEDFNTDLHEALTKIPAPDAKLKGKIIDVVQKGYYLNDKVIRFAKVVVGE